MTLTELIAAATPGPWEQRGPDVYAPDNCPVVYCRCVSDAAMIVAAVNALPALIAALKAADAYVDSPNAATQEAYADARAAVGEV